MEEYFYEFWKNQLITLEKGQEQMQDMTKSIIQGLSGFEEIPEMFGKFCSMDFWSKETCDYIKAWDMTTEDFQKFFKYYLDLMGLVPKDEYLELANKYNNMDESVADKIKEISKQVKIVADQEKMITDQKKEIVDQKKRVVELEKEISEQKMLVVDQKKLATDLKKEISDQKKMVADQNKEIANQKERVADLEKEIAGQVKSIKQLQSRTSV
jgi:DNA repair exonuclease SbcCD ATPase subunit